MWNDWAVFPWMPPLMALGFGVHLVFFSKEKLPAFYDQYQLNFVSDGMFRMNIIGVHFNNRNWPRVLNAMRTWSCVSLAGWLPVFGGVYWAVSQVLPSGRPLAFTLMGLTMFAILGGLFIPVVVVGKKYE